MKFVTDPQKIKLPGPNVKLRVGLKILMLLRIKNKIEDSGSEYKTEMQKVIVDLQNIMQINNESSEDCEFYATEQKFNSYFEKLMLDNNSSDSKISEKIHTRMKACESHYLKLRSYMAQLNEQPDDNMEQYIKDISYTKFHYYEIGNQRFTVSTNKILAARCTKLFANHFFRGGNHFSAHDLFRFEGQLERPHQNQTAHRDPGDIKQGTELRENDRPSEPKDKSGSCSQFVLDFNFASQLYFAGSYSEMEFWLLYAAKYVKPDESHRNSVLKFSLALACHGQGRYQDALVHLTQCVELLNHCVPDATILSDLSVTLSTMAKNLTHLCRYKEAIEYYKRSIDVHQLVGCSTLATLYDLEKSCFAKHTEVAILARYNMCISLSHNWFEKGRQSCNDGTPEDLIKGASSYGNLLHSCGNHEEAIELYEDAIKKAKEENDDYSLCWIYGNLGNSYLSLGEKCKGVHYLEEALKLTYEHDPSPSSISRALNNLGTGRQALEDIEGADDLYDQALCHAIYGEDVNGQARAYGNIGNLCMLIKDYERAIPHYTEVLNISSDQSVSMVAHHNRGCSYYEFAEVKRQKCNPVNMQFQYKVFGPHAPHQTSCAKLDEKIYDLYKQGLSDFSKVISEHEAKFSDVKLSLNNPLKLNNPLNLSVCLFETNLKTFARAQDCAYCLGDHHRALLLAEQCRSRTLAELMLKRKSSYLNVPLHSPFTLDQVVNTMHLQEPNIPVVMLSWTGNRLLGWILIYDGKEVTMDTFEQEPSEELFNEKSFDTYLQYYLGQILSGDLEYASKGASDYPKAEMEEGNTVAQNSKKAESLKLSPVETLYELLAEPLREIISHTNVQHHPLKKKKIILITDSTTKLIPFDSLGKDDNPHLFGDDFIIQFMPSLLTLGIMSQTPPVVIQVPFNANDMCIVGDPVTPPFTVNDCEWILGPLPHAKEEAEWVGHYMKAKPLLQNEPTKNVVISRLKSAKLIHLATHGSASKKFLVLAGNTYDTQTTLSTFFSRSIVENTKQLLLYASDVESLSLTAGLVVLSSCDSSRGVIKGDDIQGMARAFLLAGAQAVITSLWKVPDKSARFFMQFLYCYLLDGLTSSEALNKASCSIRAFEEFSSMIHWSGYQITGKDITVQQLITDKERAVKQMLGRKCSPFPRLEVLNNLKMELIDQNLSDIQIVCGSSDVFLTEPIIDFIIHNHSNFLGGVIWANAYNSELFAKQCAIVDKVIKTDVPLLIVIDTLSPELMELALKRIQDYPKASIIVKLPCLSGKHINAQIGSRRRLLSTYDVSALTDIQVTQRLVYCIQCNHSLVPGKEEREALSYLSSLCFGSPFITQLMSALIDKFIVKYDSPNEGIKMVQKKLQLLCYHFPRNVYISTDTDFALENVDILSNMSSTIIDIVIKEQLIPTASILLLKCLCMFGSLPIPQSVVVAVSEKIVAHCSSEHSVPLPSEVWDTLYSLSLLHRYPSLALPDTGDLPTTNLYFVPEIIIDGVLAKTAVIDSVADDAMCAVILHLALEGLVSDCLSSSIFVIDCLYFPELVQNVHKLLHIDDMYPLEVITRTLRDCWL